MIQVTLTFVSIEALRAALLDIPETALVGAPARPIVEPAKPMAEAPGKPTPAATEAAKPARGQRTAEAAPAAAPEKTDAEPTPAAAPAVAEPPASTAAAEAVDYPTLQKAVFTLAGKSRQAAADVAASFGVKTFKELPQDKWADALAAVQAKTAEL